MDSGLAYFEKSNYSYVIGIVFCMSTLGKRFALPLREMLLATAPRNSLLKKGLLPIMVLLKVFSEKNSLITFSVKKMSGFQVSYAPRSQTMGKNGGSVLPAWYCADIPLF